MRTYLYKDKETGKIYGRKAMDAHRIATYGADSKWENHYFVIWYNV